MNPTTVLPQAPSKLEANAAPKKGEKEALSNDFEAKLKQGIEKESAQENEKDAAATAGVMNLAKVAPQVQVPIKKGDEAVAQEKGIGGEKITEDPKLAQQLKALINDKSEIQTQSGTPKFESRLDAKAAQQINSQVEKLKNGTGEGVPAAILQSMLGEGIDTSSLESSFDHDFKIEELEVKDALGTGAAAGAEQKPSAHSSKLSTSDYLNLRELAKKSDQGLDLGTSGKSGLKKEKLINPLHADLKSGAPFSTNLQQTFQLQGHQGKVVEAPTTQGTAGKTILSHDAVQQLTGQVNLLSQARQDGEIKIRLRPDHLGELMMNVKTQGQQVAIQIKAQDGTSKKIIEESLGALRDSLSKQSLTLSQVEVVTQPQSMASDQSPQMDQSGQRQDFGQSSQGFRNENQNQGGRQERLYEEPRTASNLNISRMGRPARVSSDQGLDLIA